MRELSVSYSRYVQITSLQTKENKHFKLYLFFSISTFYVIFIFSFSRCKDTCFLQYGKIILSCHPIVVLLQKKRFMSDYTLLVGIIQFLAAVVLFFIVNWIGSKSISVGYIQLSTSIAEDSSPAFNFLFKVIAPPVYLVLYATICQTSNANWLNVNCYLLVIYYWAFRGLFILATGKCRLTNWITFGLYALFSIGISYGIYKVLNDVDKILPDPKDLLNQLWLLIIIFLYNILNKMEFGRDRTIRRKESYLSRQFMVFNTKYGSLVHSKCQNEFLEAIVFAIMIYENFNRPRVVRWIEYARFFLQRKSIHWESCR